MANTTTRDAYRRVLDARMGSLSDESSEAYLATLEAQVIIWLDHIKDYRADKTKSAEAAKEVV